MLLLTLFRVFLEINLYTAYFFWLASVTDFSQSSSFVVYMQTFVV